MEVLTEKESLITSESGNLQFINLAEQKEELYLFKSVEDAELTANKLNASEQSKKTIAVIKNCDEQAIIEAVCNNITIYEKLTFACFDDNFTSEDVSLVSLVVDTPLYESKGIITVKGFRRFHSSRENLFSKIVHEINQNGHNLFGKKVNITSYASDEFLEADGNEKYLFYKNMLIKIWVEYKKNFRTVYFKILSNYSFAIASIYIYDDETKKQDLELKLTDLSGEESYIKVLAKDKYNISGFRKMICPMGKFLDFMSGEDFNKILNQLYSEQRYKVVNKYDRPGLIEDENVWLTADEVISLEN